MTLTFDQSRTVPVASILLPGRVPRRWPAIWALLAVLVFSIQATFVVGYGAVRFNVDSPVVPNPTGSPMFRVHDHGPGSGSPGYRAIVAISMAIGTGPTGIIVLQVVLATFAAIRLEGVGRSLGGTTAGLVSVSLFVLNPDQIRWHAYLLPDSLYTSALILTIAAIQAAWRYPTPGRLLIALAWALGAGTLNATGYLLVPIILAFWSRGRAVPGARWAGVAMTLATLACILLLLPVVRATILKGRTALERPDRGVVIRDFAESWLPMPAQTDSARSSTISAIAYTYEHPWESIHLATLRVLAALAHVRPYYTMRHNLAVLSLLVPIYLLAVLGLAGARCEPLTVLLAGVVAVHLLVIAITDSDWDGRSLLVALPLIGLLAARGLVMLRWRCKVVLTLAFAAILMAILHPAFLTRFARQFRVDDPAPSDALVLLLGGDRDRPEKAAELYRRGLGELVLLGSDSDLKLNRDVLIERGVPARAIMSLGPTIGTREEAWRVRDYATAHPEIRRITVVTTAFHTVRARWIFRRALMGIGVEVRIAASIDPRFNETDWYTTVAGVSAYTQELLKMVYAYISMIE